MKKWILFLFFTLILVIGNSTVYADQETSEDTVQTIAEGQGWTIFSDGKMTVDASARLNYANRADVEWYKYMNRILSLEVKEGVTSIGTYAFCDAGNLMRVSLPEGLKNIGLRAFSHCNQLQTLTLPESLESIDYWAFAGCDSLEQIIIGGGKAFTELDNYAFQGCEDLLRAVILDPVERLGYDVLENCTSMKELYLPESLRLIDKAALRNCPGLTDIYYAGSSEQWNKVKIEIGNEETISRAEIHFNSLWDPQMAEHVSLLRPEQPKDKGILLWKILQLAYSSEDYYAFAKGNLDKRENMLAAIGEDRKTVEDYLEQNYIDLLMIPRGETYHDTNFYFVAKSGLTDFAPEDSLAALRRNRQDEADAFLANLEDSMGLKMEPEFVEYGGIMFARYHTEEHNIYLTLLDSYVFALFFVRVPESEAAAMAMEMDIMEHVSHYTVQPAEDVSLETPASVKEYTFMDGKLTLRMDTDAWDVFLQENVGNETALEHQGFTREQMDFYMQGLGYQLTAVPAGESFLNSDSKFLLHVKNPAYPGLKNLKDFSASEIKLFGDTIVNSFGVSKWDLVETADVDYFVFEAMGSVRYATIVDECMVYFYIKTGNGNVTDEQRQMLKSIMRGVSWNLD